MAVKTPSTTRLQCVSWLFTIKHDALGVGRDAVDVGRGAVSVGRHAPSAGAYRF